MPQGDVLCILLVMQNASVTMQDFKAPCEVFSISLEAVNVIAERASCNTCLLYIFKIEMLKNKTA